MPFDAKTHGSTDTLAAYVCSDAGAALAAEVCALRHVSEDVIHGGGLCGAARLTPDAFSGGIVLTELGQEPLDMACDCVAELCKFGVDVIVFGHATDLASYRALKQAGALDYFSIPVAVKEICAAWSQPTTNTRAKPNDRPVPTGGIVMGVVGCAGGVGASLLAQNLAAYAASQVITERRVALLDADLEFGTQAIDLNRDETGGLLDALSAPERIDSTFVNATMDQVEPTLSLYSAPLAIGCSARKHEPNVPALMTNLAAEFGTVIADIPRGTLLRERGIAPALDVAVLVIPRGFAGVHTAKRIIAMLRDTAPDLRILPVLSDLRTDAALSPKDIDNTLEVAHVSLVPDCGPALVKAHRAATPLIRQQPRSAWAKSVRRIWTAAQETPAQQGEGRRRWRIFG